MDTPRTGERPTVEEMAVVHKAFRREFRLLPPLVRAVPAGDVRRAGVVAGHVRLIITGLHVHHTGEDAILWPLLRERAEPAHALVARMQEQHEQVDELIGRIGPLVDRFAAEAAGADELADALDDLRAVLIAHLGLEEAEIVPLAERHLTAAEWQAVGGHGRETMPARQLPLMFGAIIEDADPAERAMMLGVMPPPLRLLLTTVGAWQYRRYISRVRG